MKIITVQRRPAQIEVISRVCLGQDPQLCCKNIRVALNINTPITHRETRLKSSCIWLKRAPSTQLVHWRIKWQKCVNIRYHYHGPGCGVRADARQHSDLVPGPTSITSLLTGNK